MIEPAYRYRAECVRVVDADTLHLRIDLGFHGALTVPVRVRGVNAPELATDEGKAARDWVQVLLRPVTNPWPSLVVESYRDRQSFARWIVDLYVGGRSFADLLVEAGHGVPA